MSICSRSTTTHDVSSNIITNFNGGSGLDSSGQQSGMAFSQMAFSKGSSLLNGCRLGNQVGEGRGGKHRNHVNKAKSGMKEQCKVGRDLKSRLGRRAKVNGQQDLRGDGSGNMNVRQE